MTRSERLIPYLFLLPAVALLLIFNLIPAVSTIRESLYTNNLSQTGSRAFVALANLPACSMIPFSGNRFRLR